MLAESSPCMPASRDGAFGAGTFLLAQHSRN